MDNNNVNRSAAERQAGLRRSTRANAGLPPARFCTMYCCRERSTHADHLNGQSDQLQRVDGAGVAPEETTVNSQSSIPAERNTVQTASTEISENSATSGEEPGEMQRVSINDMICRICSAPFRLPTATKCGHVFCKSCITGALTSNSHCPVCSKRLSARKDLFRIFLS